MITETVSREGVLISAELLETAGIHLGDAVELRVEGDQLIVRSVDAQERERRFKESKDRVFAKHRQLFEALAEGGAMIFLAVEEALEIHYDQIEVFGGAHGVRDEGAFRSALAAAENRAYYEAADVITCGATYAFHLCQAHAFIDGNKRVAAAVMLIFLDLNGKELTSSEEENISLFLSVASGETSRDELEAFLRAHVR